MTKEDCEWLRQQIKAIADKMRTMKDTDVLSRGELSHAHDPGEAIANVMLAYRHLEDASMRIGKVMQALDGGVSVYDRTQVPGA